METKTRSWGALAVLGLAVVSASALGSVSATQRGRWYRRIRKSSLNPPDWVFGPVWTALYALMTYSAWRVWRRGERPERNRAMALWAGQLALNAAWSPLFFGAHRPRAALADLAATFGTAAAYARAAREIDKPAAAMMLPYLGWLGFAGVLNEEVVRLNRR